MSTISATDNSAAYAASSAAATTEASAETSAEDNEEVSAESATTSDASSSADVAQSSEVVETATATQNAATDSTKEDSVALSSRAEKIQKLNAEFFPGGPSTVSITPEFIKRLEEYQLISSEAALTLGAAANSSSETNSITQITNAIDEVADNAKTQDPQSSLIETLANAKEVIKNFGISTSTNNYDIKAIMAELASFRQSEQASWLSDDDKKNLDQIELALNVADQMNPQSSTSDQLDKYVSIYNQTQTS